MNSVWSKLFIVTTILLVSYSASIGYFWYQLNAKQDQLDNTEVKLADALLRLDNIIAQLTDTKTQLDTTKAQLIDTQAQLDTTQVQLDTTQVQLDTTQVQLDTTQTQLGEAKDENSQMLNQYAGLKKQIDIRLGLSSQDQQSFITPNNSSVSDKVQDITGGYTGESDKYWRDCERLYRWVVENISYSYDSHTPLLPSAISDNLKWHKGYWRMPEETLEDETGDCEDMAVLLASLLLSYNEGEYLIWVLGINSDDPEIPGHLAVALPVQGGGLIILDPAGNYYTGYQLTTLKSWSASSAVNDWLAHWNWKVPDGEVIRVFSESIYYEFSNTAEFLTWLEEPSSRK